MVAVSIYAEAPATSEERAAAIAAYRDEAKQSLATGVGNLPTSNAAWIEHIDLFTQGCKRNNDLAIADRRLIGSLEYDFGGHWRFGLELIRAGMEVAMPHQQEKVRSSNGAQGERDGYKRLLTSFQVATTAFHAFGNPALRGSSIH